MKAAFIFSGQGAQFVGMGKDLYDHIPEAKAVFDRADQVLGRPLSEICFEGPAEKLTESTACQPAIYTMSMACLRAFQARFPAIEPIGVAGLSLGEYAALAAAECISFDEGIRLLAQRAQFMNEACQAAEGGMASVLGGDNTIIAEVCAECGVDVANYNCPGQTVISGEKEKVLAAVEALKAKGMKKVIPLNVAGAFHSRLMRSAGDKLVPVLAVAEIQRPKIKVAQNFSGETVSDPVQIRQNLAEQVAGSVRWEACVRTLIASGADTVIEFGPGNVLTGLAKRIDPEIARYNIGSLADLESFQAL